MKNNQKNDTKRVEAITRLMWSGIPTEEIVTFIEVKKQLAKAKRIRKE